jgi:hypothetical protein
VLPAAHVRHVSIGADTILLDLRRDRYLSIATAAFEALTRGDAGVASAMRMQMMSEGGFASAHEVGGARQSERSWSLVARVVASCFWAHAKERSRRLDLAVAELARIRVASRDNSQKRADEIARFMQLRPWYPRRPVCLFDSLALTHFLLRAGHRAQIVFGVRTHPFAAHAWVEADQHIVNDEQLYCASFTEILRAP